jgi:hypothetical protein
MLICLFQRFKRVKYFSTWLISGSDRFQSLEYFQLRDAEISQRQQQHKGNSSTAGAYSRNATSDFPLPESHVWALQRCVQTGSVGGGGMWWHLSSAKLEEHSPLRHCSNSSHISYDWYHLQKASQRILKEFGQCWKRSGNVEISQNAEISQGLEIALTAFSFESDLRYKRDSRDYIFHCTK